MRFTAGRKLRHPALMTRLQIFALHSNGSIMVLDLQKLLLMCPRNGQSDPATPGVTLRPIVCCAIKGFPSNGMRAALLQVLGAVLFACAAQSTFHHLPSSPWLRQRAPMIQALNRRLERVRSNTQRGLARLQSIFSLPQNLLRGKLPMQNSGSKVVRNLSQRMKLPKGTLHQLNRFRSKIRDSAVRGMGRLQGVSKIPQQGLRGNLPLQGGGAHGLRNLSQRLQGLQLPQFPQPPSFQRGGAHGLRNLSQRLQGLQPPRIPQPPNFNLRRPQTSQLSNIFNSMFPSVQRLQRNASQRLKRLTNLPPYLNQYNFLRRA